MGVGIQMETGVVAAGSWELSKFPISVGDHTRRRNSFLRTMVMILNISR